MGLSIDSEYEARRSAAQATYAVATTRARRLLYIVLASLAATAVLAIKAFYGWLPAWWVLAPIACILAVEPLRHRAVQAWMRAIRLVHFYEDGLSRIHGTQPQTSQMGEQFARAGHLFATDLSVLGPHSLFAMLATTRTAVGARALADILLDPIAATEARTRQAAVRELSTRLDLREEVSLLGRSAYEQVPAESFLRWTARNDRTGEWSRRILIALRLAFALTVASWLALLAFAYAHHGSTANALRNAAALLALQACLSLLLRTRVVEELAAVERLAGQTAILRAGLHLLQREKFTSARLLALQAEAAGEEHRLASLERILTLAEQRTKEWYYLIAMLFATGSQTALALMQWRHAHGEDLRRGVAAWAQFEALLALAGYAQEHPENAWPEIVDASHAESAGRRAEFNAEALCHPLLPRDAVANDIHLGDETNFLLISGSNMAGKSTLLRAIGANAVLAFAGAPVCARSMRLTAMPLAASIGVGDSLAEGRSKFLAEAERLRDMLALAKHSPVLFLIDEIFSGTNSADRRIAAEAVLRGLTEAGAVGALSTHDLALTEVEGLGGRNVHMASPDPDDPLRFDYLLKPGVNTTTNALAIVRMLFENRP